jgi:hypothetical protein
VFDMIRFTIIVAMGFCCATSARAVSIGSLDLELSIGSATIPHDSYAWPYVDSAMPSGQSCILTGGGALIGVRTYTGYSDEFQYQAAGNMIWTAPSDTYTIDIRVSNEGGLMLPPGVMGTDGFPLDKMTLRIGGDGLGDRDGSPDPLNPDLFPADDHFKILGGSFRAYSSTAAFPANPPAGNQLQAFTVGSDPSSHASWSGQQTFNAANVRMLLFRLTIQEVPEPAAGVVLALLILVRPGRRKFSPSR